MNENNRNFLQKQRSVLKLEQEAYTKLEILKLQDKLTDDL